VPGLLPGSVTVGSFLRVLPSIKDNNSILVNLSIDLSSLNSIGNATTGAGASYQQIQWANTTGSKSVVNLLINQNESIVTAGITSDSYTSNSNNSLEGASKESKSGKNIFVLIIKPRIIKSS
jgi:type II secretory pathway component GspD/PulD (secretin)